MAVAFDELPDWSERLGALVAAHGVPGAALGILRIRDAADGSGDDLTAVATGVLNKATGVTVTPDSVFQIGSISKVWTTTLAMQLVDEGLLDLDRPVVEVLPELALADADATASITLRHLLSHSSGLDGDAFLDTGRGDDALQRFVAELRTQPQLFPPGSAFSYCNAGFGIVGRVIEVVLGLDWDTALRRRLIQPLGLTGTSTLPEEAILRRAAVGHLGEPGADSYPTRSWMFARCAGPAGLVNSTVADLLTFVRMHLARGVHTDGVRILSQRSAVEMQQPQVGLPAGLAHDGARCLGWWRERWSGSARFGHDGAVIGQYAYLDVLPEHGLAVALFTNGPGANNLWAQLRPELWWALAGVAVPSPVEPPTQAPVVALGRHVGSYGRRGHRLVVSESAGRLVVHVDEDWGAAAGKHAYDLELVPVDQDLFVTRMPNADIWSPLRFGRLPDGRDFVYHLGRVNARSADSS